MAIPEADSIMLKDATVHIDSLVFYV